MFDFFHKKYFEIQNGIYNGAFIRADLPADTPIYHYTSLEVLRLILNGKKFYATEYNYLNDIDEFSNVDKYLLEVIAEEFGDEIYYREFALNISEAMISVRAKSMNLNNSFYVISFSKNPDNLTLWSEFASYGCNMGFTVPYMFAENVSIVYAGSVLYDKTAKKSFIKYAISEILQHYFETEKSVLGEYLRNSDSAVLRMTALNIAELVSLYGSIMKSELYHAEDEYRIVFSGRNHNINYRTKGDMMIPFIELPLNADSSAYLNKVTLAPLTKSPLNILSVHSFLRDMGYDKCDVAVSGLNLRY